jgi:hypothetical protein
MRADAVLDHVVWRMLRAKRRECECQKLIIAGKGSLAET